MAKSRKPGKPKAPRKRSQIEVTQGARSALAKLSEALEWDAHYRVHPNADGTVDAELRVKVPRPGTKKQVYDFITFDLMVAMVEHAPPGDGWWLSAGFLLRRERLDFEAAQRYAEKHSMPIIDTHFVRTSDISIRAVSTLIHVVLDRMTDKLGDRVIAEIIMRYYWHPKGYRRKRLTPKKPSVVGMRERMVKFLDSDGEETAVIVKANTSWDAVAKAMKLGATRILETK